MTAEASFANVGTGGQNIPSGRLGYARRIISHVDATTDLRFSHLQTFNNSDFLQRGNFSYLDASVGFSLHPLNTEHHRLDLGLSGALRKRWETRAIRADVFRDEGEIDSIQVTYERRTSVDVGYLLRIGYSYQLSSTFRLGIHFQGYTYREGTSLILAGLSVDYLL